MPVAYILSASHQLVALFQRLWSFDNRRTLLKIIPTSGASLHSFFHILQDATCLSPKSHSAMLASLWWAGFPLKTRAKQTFPFLSCSARYAVIEIKVVSSTLVAFNFPSLTELFYLFCFLWFSVKLLNYISKAAT